MICREDEEPIPPARTRASADTSRCLPKTRDLESDWVGESTMKKENGDVGIREDGEAEAEDLNGEERENGSQGSKGS